MSFVLFFIYLSLFSWLLTKIRFVINSRLSPEIIIGLFVFKVAIICVYAFMLMQSNSMLDSIFFNIEGLKEYHLLINNPKQYFISFFHSGYQNGYDGLLSTNNSYWKDLQSNIIIRFLSVCDIFTGGNYYLNIIFFNFIVFFGGIGFYRVYAAIYSNKNYLIICTCFLLPSLLIYTGVIHKEGLIFTAMGIVVYNMYVTLQKNGSSLLRLICILTAMSFIFLQRNYVLLAMLPAIFAWMLSCKKKYTPFFTFLLIYIIGIILFFTAHFISPNTNFPKSLVNKQAEFSKFTTAVTYIKSDTLQASFKSFAGIAPQAFEHGFLRPFFTDIKLSVFLFPLALEVLIYQMLFLLYIFFRDKKSTIDPFIYFGIFFSISIMLIIGYTIPIIGAIVRYRSIYLPFLLTPFICSINWQKIRIIFK